MELTFALKETRDTIRRRPFSPGSGRNAACLTSLTVIAVIVACNVMPAGSQETNQYLAFEDFFDVGFTGEPTVRESTYETELGIVLPARIYSAEDDYGRYSVTVVDWRGTEELYEALLAGCQDCDGAMPNDIRGAALNAAFGFLKRGSEVTHLGQNVVDGVRGVRIHLSNEDGSRTAAVSHWHEYRLYIVEATAPSDRPPALFVDSVGFIDQEGRRIRYRERYAPLFPDPGRSP